MGYSYRQRVVHDIRKQYEEAVLEIQFDSTVPLAKETVTWPSKVALCFPVFKQSTSQDTEETTAMPLVSNQVSTPGASNLMDTDQLAVSKEEVEGERQVIFKQLSKDKESLLELRSKLGMELVWLKQAITSRQKVKVLIKSSHKGTVIHTLHVIVSSTKEGIGNSTFPFLNKNIV